eukprot:750568-Hanusia_phi.AAC.3
MFATGLMLGDTGSSIMDYIDGRGRHFSVSSCPLRGGCSMASSSEEFSFDSSKSSSEDEHSSCAIVDMKAFYDLARLKHNPTGKIWHTKEWKKKIREKKMYKGAKRVYEADESGTTEYVIVKKIVTKEDVEYWKDRQHLVNDVSMVSWI